MIDWKVYSVFDKINCWHVFTFFHEEKEIGEMMVDINNDYAFIFKICSHKTNCGYGTNMINHLKSIGIRRIQGDADPDSIGFWNKFEPIWSEDSFEIRLLG